MNYLSKQCSLSSWFFDLQRIWHRTCRVEAGGTVEGRERLQTEVNDGSHDASDGDDGEYTRCQRAGWLLA